MKQEQKREVERLLEPHKAKVLMLITLLSTWLEAEECGETRNMIWAVLIVVYSIRDEMNETAGSK
ncbi:hypothetical protein J7S75_11340 [Providencia huaxiensis]|uniref:hypothetical protein n=1 Tax=Providencia huaxiensis TaxID=2027290 RepID=UPI001B380CAB|nr:hypothetical protein [Providencia huaxiensis]MBQ0534930.1 hypothetical protein [Providencia huaxiensis]MBQ0590104.1 hypothetical protein [Providencia huaxiensis]